jgi:hypothetical protein
VFAENGANGMRDLEAKAATEGVSDAGNERVSILDFSASKSFVMRRAIFGCVNACRTSMALSTASHELLELMIEHGIGVEEEHAYSVKKIDSDYFGEA